MVKNRTSRLVAAFVTIALAVTGVMLARARTAPKAAATAATSTPGLEALNPASADPPAAAGNGLLSMSPEGTTGLATYSAAGSVAASTGSSSWIKSAYPKQATATQSTSDPATTHWALLIGLNDYAGGTEDNVGSRQDAESMQTMLLKLGWRSDHIMLIRDRAGTASHIIDAIRWLASKTNSSSTAVFEYAGHENWTVTSADGDNEAKDVEIWAADNRLIIDGTLGREMGRVTAGRMWLDFATCRAAGFNDTGMIKSGRILTYSSPVNEFSYEDPRLHHSVFGYFLVNQGMYGKKADANHDGKVSVEEAFSYARPQVVAYTSRAQHPVLVDKQSGSMFLTIPPKPKPAPSSSQNPGPVPSTSPKACFFICF